MHRPLTARLALASLCLLAGCTRGDGGAGLGSGSQPIIMDQLHNGGTEGFLFLPPMVPRPAAIGDIVPELPVTVRVDEIRQDGSTIRSLATFRTGGGPRGERLRYHVAKGGPDPDDLDGDEDPTGYYLARWKTADENLSLAALYRVRVLVPASGGKQRELGFADVDVVRNQRQFRSVDTQNFTPLIDGETLRIKFRVDRPAVDADADGVLDWSDNCPLTANANQADSLGNGLGDACRCDQVECTPADSCHVKGVCSGKTGTCDSPTAPDGTSCPVVNASASCSGGTCKLLECLKGFADCDGKIESGCETAVDTVTDCGACGVVCAEHVGETASCKLGLCSRACRAGFADCDGKAETGCERDVTSDAANCGACGVGCKLGQVCEKGACTAMVCSPGTVDCNGEAGDGCEVKPEGDANNCGGCGIRCLAVPRTTVYCLSSVCTVAACDKGFADCNALASDGCEQSLLDSVAHCGACNSPCVTPNGTPSCTGGACGLAACDKGFADCNKFSLDGCEVNLTNNIAHCGACLNKCVTANGTPSCDRGQCAIGSCDKGFADCNGLPGDGCEVSLNSDVKSCGACGVVCVAGPNSVPVCKGGDCAIACTTRNHFNCDGVAANGCEVDTLSDARNCGACGVVCGLGTSCVGGACTPVGCGPRVGDCDGLPGNGCETQLTTDPDNCGGCGIVCLVPHAFPTCVAGSCSFTVCHNGWADCDGLPGNGCEAAIGTDLRNCGGCGVECGAGSVCDAGVCTVQVLSLSKGPSSQHSCAVLAGGVVKCWGENGTKQLGDGTFTDRFTPVRALGLPPVASVVTSLDTTCALLQTGTVRCWGWGANGRRGDGTNTQFVNAPTTVLTGPGTPLSQVVELSAGAYHFCARLQDGTARCWGINFNGTIGDGTQINRSYATATSNLSGAVSLSCGEVHTCAALGDGSVRCWGPAIQLAVAGAAPVQTTPMVVPGLSGVVEVSAGVSFTCARIGDGSVRCWGANPEGQLGDGSYVRRTTPVAFTDDSGAPVTTARELATGYNHTCVRLADGTVRCAGLRPGNGIVYPALGAPNRAVHVLVSAGGAVLQGVVGLGVSESASYVARGGGALGWGRASGNGNNYGQITDVPVPIVF